MVTMLEAPEKPHLRESVNTALLTASDRCDQCGAQAYVRIEFAPRPNRRMELFLCGHHYHRGEVKIRQTATAIQDETWRLQTTS